MKENVLNKEFKCLNHGFVRLVDVMGDDSSIVQAARVSYGQGTKTIREDRGLINYLLAHAHTSPFEMVEFKFHCKMPIFVARQWIRHRTASVNEISGRYSEMKDDFYVPEIGKVNIQSKDNKQGRGEELEIELQKSIINSMTEEQKKSYENYQSYLEKGTAKELARIDLPLSLYTEWYWKIDLHNLFHFLRLRLDSHAQYEIRVFGEAMYEIVKECCPMASEAFEEHVLHSKKFSKTEMNALKEILQIVKHNSPDNAKTLFSVIAEELGISGKSKEEFLNKLV
jgi:thymidylate synthase (FAD)